MPFDPFKDATAQNDESKKRLLDAVAAAGTAGQQQFEQAQAALKAQQSAALQRAADVARINGLGVDTGASNRFQDAYGQRLSALTSQNEGFQGALRQTGQSGQSYLEKLGATLPVLAAANQNKVDMRDKEIQALIAKAKAQAEAEAAAQQAKFEHDMQIAQLKENGLNARAVAAQQAKAAKQAAADSKLTKAKLLGAGQSLSDNYAAVLGMAPGSKGTFSADESARALAAYRNNAFGDGPDATEVNTLLGPRSAPKTTTAPPPQFDKGWLTGQFTNYDGKKISGTRADEVLRAPEVALANQMAGTLSGVKYTNGRIDDDSVPQEYRGMTAKDAFNKWLDTLPGVRTMKTAVKDYYSGWLDTLG